MKGILGSTAFVVLVAASLASAATASVSSKLVTNPIAIEFAGVQPDQRIAVTWTESAQQIDDFGAIQFSYSSATTSDGNFTQAGSIGLQTIPGSARTFVFTNPWPAASKPGALTLYVTVFGWDDACTAAMTVPGAVQNVASCKVWSPVTAFTIYSKCTRVLARAGHYVKYAKKRVFIKPVYGYTNCSWSNSA
jgi:hypothetical protein